MFGYFKKRKIFFQKKSSGSALIMTMIMMVNAILIMSAATAISFRENKNSGIAKISAIALQASDSGAEWALEKYRPEQANTTNTLKNVFDLDNGAKVLLKTGNDLGLGASPVISFKFYFLNNSRVPLVGATTVNNVYFIRSVATVTAGGNIQVTRALEARVKE